MLCWLVTCSINIWMIWWNLNLLQSMSDANHILLQVKVWGNWILVHKQLTYNSHCSLLTSPLDFYTFSNNLHQKQLNLKWLVKRQWVRPQCWYHIKHAVTDLRERQPSLWGWEAHQWPSYPHCDETLKRAQRKRDVSKVAGSQPKRKSIAVTVSNCHTSIFSLD